MGLAAFYIKNNHGFQQLKIIIIGLTAGGYIPLDFFPDWFNKIVSYLPFQYLFYWPIQIFLNRDIMGMEDMFLKIIFTQLFWIVSLYIVSRIIWIYAIKKYCAAGG